MRIPWKRGGCMLLFLALCAGLLAFLHPFVLPDNSGPLYLKWESAAILSADGAARPFDPIAGQPELEEGKERAWLLQVTANQCRDLWRRLRRRATVPLEEARAVAVLPPKVETVWETVKTLKPMDRGALYLFYYEGYSTGEIAQMLRVSQSSVTSRLCRARKKLKEQLEQEGYHETGV